MKDYGLNISQVTPAYYSETKICHQQKDECGCGYLIYADSLAASAFDAVSNIIDYSRKFWVTFLSRGSQVRLLLRVVVWWIGRTIMHEVAASTKEYSMSFLTFSMRYAKLLNCMNIVILSNKMYLLPSTYSSTVSMKGHLLHYVCMMPEHVFPSILFHYNNPQMIQAQIASP